MGLGEGSNTASPYSSLPCGDEVNRGSGGLRVHLRGLDYRIRASSRLRGAQVFSCWFSTGASNGSSHQQSCSRNSMTATSSLSWDYILSLRAPQGPPRPDLRWLGLPHRHRQEHLVDFYTDKYLQCPCKYDALRQMCHKPEG